MRILVKNVTCIYSMSIATLKRKTAAKYNNMSVDVPQFSIVGGTRNQGWVGQGVRSRTIPPTRMRGDTQKGNGGCCGTYNVAPLVKECCTNNASVMKRPSLGTNGMLQSRYRWVRRPQPYTSVKPGAGNILYRTSDEYTKRKARNIICPTCVMHIPSEASTCMNCDTAPTMFNNRLNTPQSFAHPYPNPTTKTEPYMLKSASTQEDYLRRLDSCCTTLDEEFLDQENKNTTSNTPFACGVAKFYSCNSCN